LCADTCVATSLGGGARRVAVSGALEPMNDIAARCSRDTGAVVQL
jgi:hypothetical protein